MEESGKHPAMVVEMPDGTKRNVSFEELVLSNNITAEAVVRLLIDKCIFTADEFVDELKKIQDERMKGNVEKN